MIEVEKLHQEFLSTYPGNHTVYSALKIQAQTLFREHRAGNPAVCIQISNWFPGLTGAGVQEILKQEFSEEDAELTIAREYGYKNWEEVKMYANEILNSDFELAINSLVNGNIQKLQDLLSNNPDLVNEKSRYGHKASLLIYIAANGVETWRQRTPPNIVEITKLLLSFGANKKTKAFVYGGDYDTIALLKSSAHPAEMGVTEKLLALLKY